MDTWNVDQYKDFVAGAGKRPGKNKYGAKRTEVDGFVFHSKKEAQRYGQLKMLEQAGQISNLKLQVPYPLKVNGALITTYIADFVYDEDGREVVEDVKGKRTQEYVIKKKLMQAVLKIAIFET